MISLWQWIMLGVVLIGPLVPIGIYFFFRFQLTLTPITEWLEAIGIPAF